MARADYHICPVCDGKALYDDSDYDRAEVAVLHPECLGRLTRDAAAEARRAAADAFTSDATGIRQTAREFIGADLLAYVQGIEYAVDRLREADTTEEAE